MVSISSKSQDLLLCSMGIMLMADSDRAASEFCRVLRPDGIAAVSTWVKMEQSKYIIEALHRCLNKPVPEASADWTPGDDWSNGDYVVKRFLAAGFKSARSTVVTGEYEITNFETYCKQASSNPGWNSLADKFNLSAEQRALYPETLCKVLYDHFPSGTAKLGSAANIIIACA